MFGGGKGVGHASATAEIVVASFYIYEKDVLHGSALHGKVGWDPKPFWAICQPLENVKKGPILNEFGNQKITNQLYTSLKAIIENYLLQFGAC